MKGKRKKYSAALKAKVGLEATLGIRTISQIAREHQVHPTLVNQWKRTIRDRLPELFEIGPAREHDERDELIAQLHQKIGELTVDRDFLKKKCKQLGL